MAVWLSSDAISTSNLIKTGRFFAWIPPFLWLIEGSGVFYIVISRIFLEKRLVTISAYFFN